MSNTSLSYEKKSIDNYLITSSSTIIAGYIVLLAMKDEVPFYSNLATIFSISSLVITILFTLWHKFRSELKKILIDKEKEKFAKELESTLNELLDMTKDAFETRIRKKSERIIKERSISNEDEVDSYIESAEFKKRISDEIEDMKEDIYNNNYLAAALAQNSVYNIEKIYDKIYNKPIEERFATSKFIIDKLSDKFRYYLFSFGLICFIVSIILNSIDL